MEEHVILVDESDREIGSTSKLQAHRDGKLHRAFSIFVFNPKGELLLQKRTRGKYHSGGLWSNTCCSHPRPGERMEDEARLKLQQEMGFQCKLEWKFHFRYHVEFSNGLIENEVDHVFFGDFDGNPSPNPDEAEDWKWVDLKTLSIDIKKNPETYTYWLKTCFDQISNLVMR
jgi:isopentenyl-diphosphate delta-isomerase